MGTEIERKFIVEGDAWRGLAEGTAFRQGYLSTDAERTVRVRTAGEKGFLNIKGKARGLARLEYEYEIPLGEADELLDRLCLEPLIEKHRYKIEHAGFLWEVDEFHGVNDGLVVAEVELESEDQQVTLPSWVGREVSEDHRYKNASLVERPYSTWVSVAG